MKKGHYIFFGVTLLGCLLFGMLFVLFRVNPYWPFILQQRKLAQTMGVRITDYPASYAFPVGYFHEILAPGMTLDEVHGIVYGYVSVYNCGYKEVYYFFSDDHARAIRFEILYEQADGGKHLFLQLQTEDDNSRSIHVNECQSGKIEF